MYPVHCIMCVRLDGGAGRVHEHDTRLSEAVEQRFYRVGVVTGKNRASLHSRYMHLPFPRTILRISTKAKSTKMPKAR